jgi:hypothetical protein
MATRAVLATALLMGLALVPLTEAAPRVTADQQLVAALQSARTASRAAIRQLSQPTPERASKARSDLVDALAALDAATKAAPQAVGALETPSVRNGIRDAARLSRRARVDIAHGRYRAAQAKITKAVELKTTALADFGVPLEKDFSSFAVNQSLRNVQGLENYSALTATVGAKVSEIVIGGANRKTANAGERRGGPASTPEQLEITKMTLYTMTEPNGEFAGGWCDLKDSLISCVLVPPMRADERFTIAFGPKPPKGTKILVKFRTELGERSYALVSLRG